MPKTEGISVDPDIQKIMNNYQFERILRMVRKYESILTYECILTTKVSWLPF